MSQHHCPAILVAAPASGQGKTTVTAALARLHARQGRRVQVFKVGPDFLDPQIHEVASGRPCYNLDLSMCGEAEARWRLSQAAKTSDLIIVEGVMGLFDGQPSSADLAILFGLPVMALIDARAMAQTFGAVVHGLATYRTGLPFAGALANRVGTARHADILKSSLPEHLGWFGALPKTDDSLPERHLGLLQASEIKDLMARLDVLADAIEKTSAGGLPDPVAFDVVSEPEISPSLAGKSIAIARDAAYGFIYPANLDLLRALGADLCFFSPLAGDPLPECDAFWLPGGYPELHTETLGGRHEFWRQLRAHVAAGKPALAECGGMMSLFELIVDKAGTAHHFAGVLAGQAVMQPRLSALGVQTVELPEGGLAGHTFHYSKTETTEAPLVFAVNKQGGLGEAVYRKNRLTASYVHLYFPSNPEATVKLFS